MHTPRGQTVRRSTKKPASSSSSSFITRCLLGAEGGQLSGVSSVVQQDVWLSIRPSVRRSVFPVFADPPRGRIFDPDRFRNENGSRSPIYNNHRLRQSVSNGSYKFKGRKHVAFGTDLKQITAATM